ncbi:hypothetical protein JZ751_012590 [Albula glossodonta]|uniref:Uncharacterized protein n=1 Tax=Albula glossodonta TaxID=121402 RepID=A0A8T2P3D7_9TELE|nr:hypothetical protein JZ751_012590 [Albula glossodonta]
MPSRVISILTPSNGGGARRGTPPKAVSARRMILRDLGSITLTAAGFDNTSAR